MYNRYIPQPDGTFRRSRMPDGNHQGPTQQRSRPEPPCPEPELEPHRDAPCPTPPPPPRRNCQQPRQRTSPRHHPEPPADSSVSSFLKKLLPKDFDTGDLLIVLLLLLMAGDCTEDQNSALLTLALYFFM